jgi:hypothetical protein
MFQIWYMEGRLEDIMWAERKRKYKSGWNQKEEEWLGVSKQ